MAEQLLQRDVTAGPVRARHDLQRDDRVAAELEEIVVHADAVDPERAAPDRRERHLRIRLGGDEPPLRGVDGMGACPTGGIG